MDIKQIYTLINDTTQEVLGEKAITADENLANVVDIGESVFNANAVDAYVRSLTNRIGRTIFVNRSYAGNAPSLLMDGWEFGSVLMKIRAELPEAMENQSWEMNNGDSVDPNIFYKPEVSATFYNKRVTFEVRMSFMEKQVKQSFTSVMELNAFISMLYNEVEKSMTVKMDALILKTLANMIGETVYDDYGADALNSKSGVKAVNLLYQYNHDTFGTTTADYITAADAIHDPNFIRYASFKMGLYADRLKSMSTLFNVDGKSRFTPTDKLHVVLLSEFKNAAGAFLQSDTFHDQYTALPNSETVPFWQASGTDYAFSTTGKIDIVTAGNHNIVVTGIIGVMFDRDACGVTNMDRRVTTNYVAPAEFYTNYFKLEAGYYNALDENFCVFFVA